MLFVYVLFNLLLVIRNLLNKYVYNVLYNNNLFHCD